MKTQEGHEACQEHLANIKGKLQKLIVVPAIL